MANIIQKYNDILILAGAGFSVDSGLPNYQGVHEMVNEVANKYGIKPYEIEHPNFYKNNPKGAWGMNARVMNIFLTKEPHSGYKKLRELTKYKYVFVVTSNIDDHFRISEFDENKLYKIHGRLKVLQCVNRSCNQKHNLWTIDYLPKEENFELIGKVPKCKFCGDYARPNVCFTDDNSYCSNLEMLKKQNIMNGFVKLLTKNPKLLVIEVVWST